MIDFNFNNIVDTLKNLYPDLTSHITFVDFKSWEENKKEILNWFKNTKTLSSLTNSYIGLQTDDNGSIYEKESDKGLVVFNEKTCISFNRSRGKSNNPETLSQHKAFTLLHETAHSIYKDCYTERLESLYTETIRENRADSFAYTLGKELGLIDKDYIKHLSNYRTKQLWINKDIEHYSPLSLNTLAENFNLETLPHEIEKHVNKSMISEKEHDDLFEIVMNCDISTIREAKEKIPQISNLFNNSSFNIRNAGQQAVATFNIRNSIH